MLNKNNLNIAKLASKEDSKYTLGGILVTPQNTVATDGHTLMVVANSTILPDDFPKVCSLEAQGQFMPFILPFDDALNIMKVMPKKQKLPILNHVAIGEVTKNEFGQIASLIATDLSRSDRFDVRCTDSVFPTWEKVIPDATAASLTLTVNAEYLIALLQQFVAAGSPAVTMRLYTAETQVRFDGVSEAGQHMTGVVMPMRTMESEPVNYELAHAK